MRLAVAAAGALAGALVMLWVVLLVHGHRHGQTIVALATWQADKRAYFAYERGFITYDDYLTIWRSCWAPRFPPLNEGTITATKITHGTLAGVVRGGEGQGGLAID